ncbi:hypothetical protein Pfo_001745 [Paulownia fortunei]|nr:hypothetical protein Pfo_001745 [Paulownia fortunei]
MNMHKEFQELLFCVLNQESDGSVVLPLLGDPENAYLKLECTQEGSKKSVGTMTMTIDMHYVIKEVGQKCGPL